MSSNVYNNEAEQCLLAAILRNPEAYYDINDVGLSRNDFANTEHQRIFQAIEQAVREKSDPTIPFVVEYLRANAKDGTISYVSDLSSVPTSIPQAKEYARLVKGLSVSRQLGAAGSRIIDISAENRSDYTSALVEAQNVLRSVEETLPKNERSPGIVDILKRMEVVTQTDRIPIDFAPTLQSFTGGLARGHFWVVGGFSSTGKSAFACNMLLDMLAHRRSKIAVVSAEMTQEQYAIRLMSILSGVPQQTITSNVTIGMDVRDNIDQARATLEKRNLYVYDNLYRMSQIRTELQRLKNQNGLDAFILDYIQNVSVTGDEVSDAREVALECQRLAKDLDVSVIAFSQVSNDQGRFDAEGGSSDYYSFKGHGAIRDAADVAIMLYRARSTQSTVLNVDIKKNRHGPIGKFQCAFNLQTGRIEEWFDVLEA